MKVTTSIIPELVWYKEYSGCTIRDALLHALQHAPDNTLTLPEIGNIKVNGNRLLGSYGNKIMMLRKEGYQIETIMKRGNGIEHSSYKLLNPTYSGSITD